MTFATNRECGRVFYDTAAQQSFPILNSGSIVDPAPVADAIAATCEIYGGQRLADNRYRVDNLTRELDCMGPKMRPELLGLRFRDMAAALDKLERPVANENLCNITVGGTTILRKSGQNGKMQKAGMQTVPTKKGR